MRKPASSKNTTAVLLVLLDDAATPLGVTHPAAQRARLVGLLGGGARAVVAPAHLAVRAIGRLLLNLVA